MNYEAEKCIVILNDKCLGCTAVSTGLSCIWSGCRVGFKEVLLKLQLVLLKKKEKRGYLLGRGANPPLENFQDNNVLHVWERPYIMKLLHLTIFTRAAR